jgi:hypothetical protein
MHKQMIRYLTLSLFVVLACIMIYVNNRKTVVSEGTFKMFNPTSSGNFEIWRYSNRHYCSDRFVPILVPDSYNRSVLQSPNKILNMEYWFGPGQYEDPRVLQINEDRAVVVFVRHYERGSICVALIDGHYDVLGSIEYTCSKTQKNWMPRLLNNGLVLYARVPDISYTIPNILGLRNHEKIEVSPVKCGEWRGSSQVIKYNGSSIGIVHKRLFSEITTYFLPRYSYAFYNFDTNALGREFDISHEASFVYINSIDVAPGGLSVFCGISDCIKKTYFLSDAQITDLLQPGPRLILNL